ncbi:MarR family transcriptional regulator [Citreicella sp. C3M06]|uniref:MarR family winged helix-turn-helix transcriptional regulator n=1 Tax=Citreicella sp. C3M06 TaxID=2841564 RepID=UPI001C085020|nr:MarR family transcriptional regulator [Citreicella sp. C3M06]MBU2961325.1 MarR family transcriptional regulator [Citreicella sp. C3M06]
MNSRRYLFHLLLHSADLIEAELAARLHPLGLRPRQALVIDGLARMGTVSQARLAREFTVTQASMSTMTARLISGGYILRRPDPEDARGNLLSLSDKGCALLSQIHQVWAEIDALGAQTLGAERYGALMHGAGALRDGLGGVGPGDKAAPPEP